MRTRIIVLGLVWGGLWAQPPLKTISEIQTPKNLAAGNDTSVLHGQVVRVRGLVITKCEWHRHYGVSGGSNSKRCSIWLIDTLPPYRGLQIRRQNVTDMPPGFTALSPGQYVELQGTVGYFQGETQLNVDTTVSPLILAIGVPIPRPVEITLRSLNFPNGSQDLDSGEVRQGSFVLVKGLTVTNVQTNPLRITVVDANGNQGLIFGEFKGLSNLYPVNTYLDSVKGIVIHFRPASGTPMYEICPWHDSLMYVGDPVPTVSNLRRTPVCPSSTASVKVQVDATGSTSDPVTQVKLYWAIGTSTNYDSITMTQVPSTSTYEATIPPHSQGTYIHYYVKVKDQSGDIVQFPRFQPQSYRVNDAGCEITDIQYVIPSVLYAYNPSARRDYLSSGYAGLSVTNVRGVVTSSENDLGYIHIQQPGASAWAGIWVRSASALPNIQIGDSVVVTNATVDEYFGLTSLRDANVTRIGPASSLIQPIVLSLNTVYGDTQYAATEPYESMLIRFRHDNISQPLRVVQPKVNTTFYSQLGDYRVGMNSSAPLEGIRVLAGRQTSNIFSSLKVSYVNDSLWATTDGLIDPSLPLCIVRDTTLLDSIQGIFTYQWNNIKLLPRTNADFFNIVKTSCSSSTTSIAQESGKGLWLGPNPTTGTLYLRSTDADEVHVSLYNLHGQRIAETTFAGSYEWNLASLPAGIYLLKVETGTKQTVVRIVRL
ncbi:MAG: T9SS type A sorting domain-containing protein [Bacteroidia bacterium]|nr:T9SS type A sorting domain-containing protein [Bacteroidia bacterium]MDW8416850.1 T9SS type A sorting domain-containing protein [Bacteroidia bacterium]